MHALEILLVEDNPGDVRLTQEALRESDLPHHLNVARDGIEALALLTQDNITALPDVILLDLNLPKKSGLEVLEEVKTDQHLKDIPIIVLTSSASDRDVLVAYKKQASAYLVKPSNLYQFDEVINAIVALCDVS
ncbi:MAG: response regulator [Chloroflexi bacterium]|nr:response regulator [Chloroflexota bacterium]MCC6894494.1 response regulator [Anaerolineae bacterium]